MTRIEVDNLSKSFTREDGGQLPIFDGLDLEIEDGSFFCLLGPSGCGKSTLLSILAGISDVDGGRILLDHHDDNELHCGFVFQRPRLLDWRTVRTNLEIVLAAQKVGRAERRDRIDRYLDMVGLSDFADTYPQRLSGGMQQRVALARALVIEPEVLLMDEPFSNLDELTAGTLRGELMEIVRTQRPTVCFVTHNPREAALLGDKVCVLSPRPCQVVDTITVDLPEPRSPEDAALTEVHKRVVRALELGRAEKSDGAGMSTGKPRLGNGATGSLSLGGAPDASSTAAKARRT